MATRNLRLTDEEINTIKESLSDEKLIKKLDKSQQKIKVSSAKGKGRNLQQKVSRDISNLLNIPYNQSDDDCLIHSREMGQQGVDVILRGEASKKFPYAIECKSTESTNVTSFIKQAMEYATKEKQWLVVYKTKIFNQPVVILDWLHFLDLYKRVLNQ